MPSFGVPKLPPIGSGIKGLAIPVIFLAVGIIGALSFTVFLGGAKNPSLPAAGNYTAVGATLQGERLPGGPDGLPSQTRRLYTNGVAMDDIFIKNASIGATGITYGIEVNASSTQTGYLTCATLTFNNVSAAFLDMTDNISGHTWTSSTSTEVDGQSVSFTASTTATNTSDSGDRGKPDFGIDGSNPDRWIIDTENTNATCNNFIVENVKVALGGGIIFRRAHFGQVVFTGDNRIGTGSGTDPGNSDFDLTAEAFNSDSFEVLDTNTTVY
tara:strand:- start:531 stop:1340 length:810 start_codon:yes stop_codon:yes gene_type:complete